MINIDVGAMLDYNNNFSTYANPFNKEQMWGRVHKPLPHSPVAATKNPLYIVWQHESSEGGNLQVLC